MGHVIALLKFSMVSYFEIKLFLFLLGLYHIPFRLFFSSMCDKLAVNGGLPQKSTEQVARSVCKRTLVQNSDSRVEVYWKRKEKN